MVVAGAIRALTPQIGDLLFVVMDGVRKSVFSIIQSVFESDLPFSS